MHENARKAAHARAGRAGL